MDGLDGELQAQVSAAITATQLLQNPAGSTYAYDQGTSGRHIENGEEMGLGIFISAITKSGTDTHEWQVLSDSNANMTTTPVVVADTGALAAATDARLVAGGRIWLPIPQNSVNQEFLGGKYIGANTPNITFQCFFMRRDAFDANIFQPKNYAV